MPPDLIAGRYRVEREVGRGGAIITYTTARGTEHETRRLIVGESGGGFVITDDQGPVSR